MSFVTAMKAYHIYFLSTLQYHCDMVYEYVTKLFGTFFILCWIFLVEQMEIKA